jgi:hypothetical protein
MFLLLLIHFTAQFRWDKNGSHRAEAPFISKPKLDTGAKAIGAYSLLSQQAYVRKHSVQKVPTHRKVTYIYIYL